MYKIKNTAVVIMLVSILLSCAETQKREQTQSEQLKTIREMPPIENSQDIVMRAASIFESAPNLTDEQKSKLHDIYTKIYDESIEIKRAIGENKTLLYMTLVKKDYKSSEVNNLTKKIVSLDKRRLDLMFKALKDVQDIVGRGAEQEGIYKQLGSLVK